MAAAIDMGENERGRFVIWVVVRNKLANLLVRPSADEQSCRQKLWIEVYEERSCKFQS